MSRCLVIDPRMESYGPFLTDSFPAEAFRNTSGVESIEQPAFDLIADWRSASYANSLASIIPSTLANFHDSYVNSHDSSGILSYSQAILAKLSQDIPELVAETELRTRIQVRLQAIAQQIVDVNANLRMVMDVATVWNEYLSLDPFRLGIHATMRQSYLALYGAYENFLVRVLGNVLNRRVRSTDRDFNTLLKGAFGAPMLASCWTEPRIIAAKRVRNSFMHAGGRVTDELRAIPIPVVVEDDSLHVFPEHLKSLYVVLRDAAKQLINSPAVRVPSSAPMKQLQL